MKLQPFLVLTLFSIAAVSQAATLYDNTAVDTFDTVLFSVGPYDAVGDQIHLTAAGNADVARVQLYNAGAGGAFDAILRFYTVGAPVGAQIGGDFLLAGLSSAGGEILDLTFGLGGLALPIDVIFMISVANAGAGTDLGVNLFEPPTVGSSDNGFLLVDLGGFTPALIDAENVYFELSESSVPEPSTLGLLAVGSLIIALGRSRRSSATPYDRNCAHRH